MRERIANQRPMNSSGRYVLYWMQAYRRLHANHALDSALRWCRELKKPLVVFEALKRNYPWASARHHAFILEGMRDHARAAKRLGVAYWPFVETPDDPGRGRVAQLAADACLVVTDDYPAFIVPAHNRAIAAASPVAVHIVDSNGVVPFSLLGPAASAAAHLRHRIHANFAEAWRNRAAVQPDIPPVAKSQPEAPFEQWDPECDIPRFIEQLGINTSVRAVPGVTGGSVAGRTVLEEFVRSKLPRYGNERNDPGDPANGAASRLSPYLRHGHLGIEEVTAAVLGPDWSPNEIDPKAKGKREGFFTRDPNVNSFLDEAIVWRDLGHHWHFAHNLACKSAGTVSWQTDPVPQFNFESFDFSPLRGRPLERVLPEWAKATLRKHVGDRREFTYTLEEFEAAATHDELWNAAQRELVHTGRIHNYLRMLWGKKVLEWAKTPSEAYHVLEHLNNKYAIDGRDPNSYTGILWCFGLFDRPWFERDIFGTVRYMSSGNTAKKFDLSGYLKYANSLNR
jgi:deoxyribodipyrimidine photo-lyase